ncbi:MAG: germination protein YpeB [Mycobacterium leprae]
MRRVEYWTMIGSFAVMVLAVWGVWTWRLADDNRVLSLQMEREQQLNFSDMTNHVMQLQGLMGKGLVTNSPRQNMRYMSDVHYHAELAARNFQSLPLPESVSAAVGKFLRQAGNFSLSILQGEAAGREIDDKQRAELARLRQDSASLTEQLQAIGQQYATGQKRWVAPARMSLSTLLRPASVRRATPGGAQSTANMASGDWSKVTATMEKLPVMIYDGPFSDGIAKRSPAMAGPPITQAEAAQKLNTFVPGLIDLRTVSVTDAQGPMPAYSFKLAPKSATGPGYTTTAEVTRNGGFPLMLLNSRAVTARPNLDLAAARQAGEAYLARIGYTGMFATYGQVNAGTATIAYAFRENGVVVYPDQVKLKIALDNGELLALDARQFIMNHHPRNIGTPTLTSTEAQDNLTGSLQVERAQLALIPSLSGADEILTWEFLSHYGNETYLVYVNANTGDEEQVLQQVQADGGTFAL